MTGTAADLLKAAASQIGYREGTNNANKFGAWYGWNNVAWCAQFVSWCANEAGLLNTAIPKFQYCPTGLNWFRTRDQTGYWPPAPGDIMFVRKLIDGVWRTPHVGIVEKYLGDGRVQTIEGNTNDNGSPTGNGVYRLIRQDSASGSGYIYARPKFAAISTAPTPAPAPQEADMNIDEFIAALDPVSGNKKLRYNLGNAVAAYKNAAVDSGDVFQNLVDAGSVKDEVASLRAQLDEIKALLAPKAAGA